MIEVTYLNGEKEIVSLEEATELRRCKLILIPKADNKALTIKDIYGEGFKKD